jgi:drug/metabolite transporter (DMT)-like permease
MFLQLLKATPLILLAQGLVMVGVFFISGQIFPTQLAAVYAKYGMVGRTVIAQIFVLSIANILCGYAMATFDPALVSPLILVASVVMVILSTVLVMGYQPSIWLFPATATVMAGCVWVSFLLRA